MTQEGNQFYPTIGQSIGITGIAILLMIVFSPVNLILNNLIGNDLSFFLYYVLAVGSTFAITHNIRLKKTKIESYDFSFSTLKIMAITAIGIIAIQIGITSPLISLIPMTDSIKQLFIEFANQNGPFAFITVVIAAPILEELIFRGIILDGLLRKYSPVKAIIISSILFGVVHLNPWQFISALIIGMFSGWVYYKTKKLTLTILMHMVNNFIAFIGTYFTDAEEMMNTSLTEQYGGVSTLILVAGTAILITYISITFLIKEFKNFKIDNWQKTP